MQLGWPCIEPSASASWVQELPVSTMTSGEGPDVDAGCLVLRWLLPLFWQLFTGFSVLFFCFVVQDIRTMALPILSKFAINELCLRSLPHHLYNLLVFPLVFCLHV